MNFELVEEPEVSRIEGDLSSMSDNLKQSMEDFRRFIQADKMVYNDKGNEEVLEIHKNGQVFKLHACGNRVDGGFFGYSQK